MPRDQLAGLAPGVAGLAAAVQQQHRRPLLAVDVAGQRVAGRAVEHRGGGRDRARHALLLEEFQHAGLEHLVADREHVVAVRDRQRLRVRHERGQFLGRARRSVLGADRDQRRRLDRRRLLARQHLARAADAGGQRPAVGFGLVGEGAEHAALRIGDVGERRRLQRLGDALRQADAVDQMHAEPAEHDASARAPDVRARGRR